MSSLLLRLFEGRSVDTKRYFVGDRLASLLGKDGKICSFPNPCAVAQKAKTSSPDASHEHQQYCQTTCCQHQTGRACFRCCLYAPEACRRSIIEGDIQAIVDQKHDTSTFETTAETLSRSYIWLSDMNMALAQLALQQRQQILPDIFPRPASAVADPATVSEHAIVNTLAEDLFAAKTHRLCVHIINTDNLEIRNKTFEALQRRNKHFTNPFQSCGFPSEADLAARERERLCAALDREAGQLLKLVVMSYRVSLESLVSLYLMFVSASQPTPLHRGDVISLLTILRNVVLHGTLLESRLAVLVLQAFLPTCSMLMTHPYVVPALVGLQDAIISKLHTLDDLPDRMLQELSGPLGHVTWQWILPKANKDLIAKAAVEDGVQNTDANLLSKRFEHLMDALVASCISSAITGALAVENVFDAFINATTSFSTHINDPVKRLCPRSVAMSYMYVMGWTSVLHHEAMDTLSWLVSCTTTAFRMSSNPPALPPSATLVFQVEFMFSALNVVKKAWAKNVRQCTEDVTTLNYTLRGALTMAVLALVRPPPTYEPTLAALYAQHALPWTIDHRDKIAAHAFLSPAGLEWERDPVVHAILAELSTPEHLHVLVAYMTHVCAQVVHLFPDETDGARMLLMRIMNLHVLEETVLPEKFKETLLERQQSPDPARDTLFTLIHLRKEWIQAMHAVFELAMILCMHPVSAKAIQDHGHALQRLLQQPFGAKLTWQRLGREFPTLFAGEECHRFYTLYVGVQGDVLNTSPWISPLTRTSLALGMLHSRFPNSTSPLPRLMIDALRTFVFSSDAALPNTLAAHLGSVEAWMKDSGVPDESKRMLLQYLVCASFLVKTYPSCNHNALKNKLERCVALDGALEMLEVDKKLAMAKTFAMPLLSTDWMKVYETRKKLIQVCNVARLELVRAAVGQQ